MSLPANSTTRVDVNGLPLQVPQDPVLGDFVELFGEPFYRIRNYDRMAPFFMSLISASDHWLFVSSTGGLTAGRINPDSALFPYGTEDRITESGETAGPKTLIRIGAGGGQQLWEPFSDRFAGAWRTERSLYKNVWGTTLVFEEINHDLELTFRQLWRTSDARGFVRTTTLFSHSPQPRGAEILDGFQNLLPYGVNSGTQGWCSVLLDAYKRNELDPASGLGLFTMTSGLTDHAEPCESLKATVVWQEGLEPLGHLLCSRQLEAFRRGQPLEPETDVCGRRGAYFVHARLTLAPRQEARWNLVADVNQDHAAVAALRRDLAGDREALRAGLEADIAAGVASLRAMLAAADGLQTGADQASAVHHTANVLFNIMRGGILADGYRIGRADFADFLRAMNRKTADAAAGRLAELPETFTVFELHAWAAGGPVALRRLCFQYLPLTFSRRHGDPSRPWNYFSINVRKADGSRNLDYQGNWRDIFQNWEALACSHPGFLPNMVATFLNATTADGYNPYRVFRHGIDWETPDPGNPWSNIGYWGDHQIIYLLKLLEADDAHAPGRLAGMLGERLFSHADIPYRIKDYPALLADPHHGIAFDHDADRRAAERVKAVGADGRLLTDVDGAVIHATLAEKLLILTLAKLTNLVPEGGVWMNTQRPEWNDANNALVGWGLSVVTLAYLHRFLGFAAGLVRQAGNEKLTVAGEVKTWLDGIHSTLRDFAPDLETGFTNRRRRAFMDRAGQAGAAYRATLYRNGFGGAMAPLPCGELLAFLELAERFTAQGVRANRRHDHLYHAYNLLELAPDTAGIGRLDEMLEGQVAVLSSGALPPAEALLTLNALRASRLYRADQHSYMLYPNRSLSGFLAKNLPDPERVGRSALAARLAAAGDRSLLFRDPTGVWRFNGGFRNDACVRKALDRLEADPRYADAVRAERAAILELFEATFHHRGFTGRSGAMYAYEGLGSVYWHMVSKLLLAVQENWRRAVEEPAAAATAEGLAACYYDIRAGLGFNKSPDRYGAFPTDPYSHTPFGQGARQPGMTGQVKEEVLTRLGELGVVVQNGRVEFRPALLRRGEFFSGTHAFPTVAADGSLQTLTLPPNAVGFTFCQVPVVCVQAKENALEIEEASGARRKVAGCTCSPEDSTALFHRTGRIARITVFTTAGRG